MQIFFLDRNPIFAAHYLCDKHVVKMPLEAVQFLSTASAKCGGEGYYGFERYMNNPCALWTQRSLSHYMWLLSNAFAICTEFKIRYNKHIGQEHKALEKLILLRDTVFKPEDNGWEDPPRYMPKEYKVPDVVQSYRNYYIGAKARLAKWSTQDGKPDWFIVDSA